MKYITFIALPVCLLSLLFTPAISFAAPAGSGEALPAKHGGIVPDCNPSLAPATPYEPGDPPEKIPCGVNKFVELIQKIIDYLKLAVIPVAVLMIGWGGFQILTSAGSEEKLNAGKKSMITAATGIIIILVSYLVIKFVFDALGVDATFKGSLFK